MHGEDRFNALASSRIRFEDWPEPLRNRPYLEDGLEDYYEAFLELSSCRQIGMGVGPIPFTAVLSYAAHYGYEGEEADILISHVRAMDVAYMEHQSKKSG